MKAIALLSGGLDSLLTAKLLELQGLEVIALHCITPFVVKEKEEIINSLEKKLKANNIKAKLVVLELGQDFLEIVKNPCYGYGKNFNPCIDCKILMLKKAKVLMQEVDAKFIATGEVLGQRPKSQHNDALCIIERDADLKGLLLRPLTAKLLPMTIPEQEGWVNSEYLFNFSGRGRNNQMNLAKTIGLVDFPWPYGGCILTEISFGGRIKDLLTHNSFTLPNVELLVLGRHFRLNENFKLVVGRDEKENNRLETYLKPGDLAVEAKSLPGPLGLGRGVINQEVKELSAKIIAYYLRSQVPVEISLRIIGQEKEEVYAVSALTENKLIKLRL